MRITLTDAAIAHVNKRRRGQPAASPTTIRIVHRGGRFRCRFQARPDRTDTVVEEKGVVVAVAADVVPELDGTTLDVIETSAGARLALRKPRAATG